MRFYIGAIVCVLLSFCFVFSCSSSSTPTLPEDSPTLTGEGHLVLMSGTMVIDTVNMEVRHLEHQVDPIHNSIFDLLTDYLTVGIVEAKADQVTLNVELENPYESELFDMRIIFTDLNGKTVINHDGFTNFFTSHWNPDYNPFIYFSKETENHAFPMGPGGIASENVMLSWYDGVNESVSYIIECSLDKNTEEPYAVTDIATFGDITPQGGSVIVTCAINDWQDDINSVKILTSEFNEQDIGMYKYQDTNIYGGNLINFGIIQPGDYTIWIQAESANSEGLSLRYPMTVTIPDTTGSAPAFEYNPYVELRYIGAEENKWIRATLRASTIDDYTTPEYEYLWEVVSPSAPQGYFQETGGVQKRTVYFVDEPNEGKEYVFKLSVKEKANSNYTSLAMTSFPDEIELSPVIVEDPLAPSEINEGEWTVLSVVAEDPNRPGDDQYLFYRWRLQAAFDEVWGKNGNECQEVSWQAPLVEEDTLMKLSVKVSKRTSYVSNLMTTEYIEILVRDLEPI